MTATETTTIVPADRSRGQAQRPALHVPGGSRNGKTTFWARWESVPHPVGCPLLERLWG
jgi:hypothetical protein